MSGMWRIFAVLAVMLVSCRKSEETESALKANPEPQQGAIRLRLMTYNIRYENPAETGSRAWSSRVIDSVRMIREERPDVFGVQETRHGQAADLRVSLPDYGFVGKGRDDGKRAGEYAAIFYRRDRFKADQNEQGVFWLSSQPDRPGSITWGNGYPRIATWVRLTDRKTNRSFYVFNTHWDHRNQLAREKSAVLMADRIAKRKFAEDPVFLLGDFNAIESNKGLKTLTAAHFVNAFPGRAGQRTTLHFWRGTTAGNLKVDHIFVPAGSKVISGKIRDEDTRLISDHFPVIVEVEVP